MTLMEQLGAVLREALAELHPDQIARRMLRWTQRWHAPVDSGAPDMPVVCLHCEESWPCDEFVRIADEMVRLDASSPSSSSTTSASAGHWLPS